MFILEYIRRHDSTNDSPLAVVRPEDSTFSIWTIGLLAARRKILCSSTFLAARRGQVVL
jgi:hypothetical protein